MILKNELAQRIVQELKREPQSRYGLSKGMKIVFQRIDHAINALHDEGIVRNDGPVFYLKSDFEALEKKLFEKTGLDSWKKIDEKHRHLTRESSEAIFKVLRKGNYTASDLEIWTEIAKPNIYAATKKLVSLGVLTRDGKAYKFVQSNYDKFMDAVTEFQFNIKQSI